MQNLLKLDPRLPIVPGAVAVLALLIVYILTPLVRPDATWPVFSTPQTACQMDVRTVRHAGGVALGAGSYAPCLSDTGMTSGEPGLAILRDGTLMRSVATDPTGIAVSSDDGAHWTRRLLPAGALTGIPDGYVDPVTDRYFYSAFGDTLVYASDDKGVTWQTGSFDSSKRYDWNKVFSGPPASARAGGYPTNIYYCNITSPGGFLTGTGCFRSVDGGRHFSLMGHPYVNGDCQDITQPQGAGPGRGVVDPRDGAIYLPVHFCGKVEIAVSHDEGATWTHNVVERMRGSAGANLLHALASPAWRRQLMSGRANIVSAEMATNQFSDAMGMDASGRLYLVWIDETFLPKISWSADHGKTWTAPLAFQAPGVVQAVLPSIAVTADGRVGLSYYGTTDRQTWTGYLAISENATAAAPTFETAAVTPPGRPLAPEACCWASGPLEYAPARWAPDGSLWGSFGATVRKGDQRGVLGRLVRR